MPVITNTPVQISGNPPDTSLAAPFGAAQNHAGPFVFGSNLYFVLCSGINDTLQVYESTDGGATYSLADTGPDTVQAVFFATSDSGTVIEIIYVNSGPNQMTYITFDPSGGGFSSPVSAIAGHVYSRSCRFSDGTFLSLYEGLSVNGLDFVRFNAGVWSTPANAFATASSLGLNFPFGLVAASSGVGHFNYAESGQLLYRNIDPADTVSASAIIDASAPPVQNGPMENWNGSLIIPITGSGPAFYEGIPISSPVWTRKDLDTSGGLFVIALPIDGSTIGFFWAGFGQTLWKFATYDGTTIGATVVYYDATNIPPPGGYDPADNFISGATVGLLSAGGYGVALHLVYDDITPAESMFYLLPTPGAPTISGTPPDGPVNVPYGPWTPTVTGGTPPYTYSIPTGSGTPPIGLTLDPATGTVSGTPTVVGTACFTVRVTDANSLHDDDPVCITITGGGYRNKVY